MNAIFFITKNKGKKLNLNLRRGRIKFNEFSSSFMFVICEMAWSVCLFSLLFEKPKWFCFVRGCAHAFMKKSERLTVVDFRFDSKSVLQTLLFNRITKIVLHIDSIIISENRFTKAKHNHLILEYFVTMKSSYFGVFHFFPHFFHFTFENVSKAHFVVTPP